MLTLLAITLIFCLCIGIAYANPEDGVVSSGLASITSDGANKLVIEQSTDRAVIDWKSFNIQVNQHTHFTQPTTNSVTLNRVNSD
ncbi:MAG: hemagglutinin, partial [Rickettsiaceae bacterium]|nr:hemagglutinin [Rickettsiaceae bacterium]